MNIQPRRLFRLVSYALLAGANVGADLSAAAPVKTPHVEAELVAERTALVPGTATTVALRLKMADGWHTYWRNPGDSGLPTTIAWALPPGVTAEPIAWPAPRPLPVGPLVNYGYESEVLLLTELLIGSDAPLGTMLTLNARADWLVCKETCIPDGADLTLALPVSDRSDPYPQWGSAIAATRAALPAAAPGWQFAARAEGQKIVLSATSPAGATDPGALHFFPYQEGRIEASGAQTLVRDASGNLTLRLPVAHQVAPEFTRLAGVISASKGFGADNALMKATTIDVPLTGIVVAGPKPMTKPLPALNLGAPAGADASMSLALAIVFAFVGGVLLNLMPCVFPVLSLKALALAAPGHENRRQMQFQGLAFAAGVVVTFVSLALLLLALRAAGEQLGWGFQLQSPAVVTALAILFFVLALNLSGAFEFASLAPSSAAGWTARNPYADAVLSGILAVIIASPCTAPLMGAAMGFALAQSPAVTIGVFVALGVGMALPYVLLSWFPTWRRALPKPGVWMERLKQLLAFPLYATVAWLVWVLGAQVDNDAVVRLLVALVSLAFVLWSWRIFRVSRARSWSVASVAGLVMAAVVAWPLFGSAADGAVNATARTQIESESEWQSYTPLRLTELAQMGKPVFVDFTAAWCVTCQVNKRFVLNDDAVKDAFARRGVELVRADWTRRDPMIAQALAALGRQGVPVYVLYRPGKEPLILPEVLQRQTVLDALATL
ncbi:MAG: thioredoxin family protein [Casimicrobiaceae bacterium]